MSDLYKKLSKGHENEKPPGGTRGGTARRVETPMSAPIVPQDIFKVTPRKPPKLDVYRWLELRRRGVSVQEAEEIVMAEWRERWRRACVATVAGQLLALAPRIDPRLTLALLTPWAATEYGLPSETVAEIVDWVAGQELQRRRGEQRAS